VREFSKSFSHTVEINFEREPKFQKVFQLDLDPIRIFRDIFLEIGKKTDIHNTLFFFDEIQACPEAIQALRYFYEEIPNIYIIAAGSLLEFVIERIGIPVGRVEFLYLYPMSFMEFLDAIDRSDIAEEINHRQPDHPFSETTHRMMLRYLAEYMAVGGMPEAVETWSKTQDLHQCVKVHTTLIETYRADFEKYGKSHQQKYINLVFEAIPRLIGKKFVFQTVSPHHKSRELAPALHLLEQAGIVHFIRHSSSNGIPLGAEVNLHLFKTIFVDIALTQSLLGINTAEWLLQNSQDTFVNRGAIAEAFVGQELISYSDPSQSTALHYWVREKSGANAEVDYVTIIDGKVVPIEVKSGANGHLKSMQLFLNEKKQSPLGIQFSKNNYGVHQKIVTYPLYAVAGALRVN